MSSPTKCPFCSVPWIDHDGTTTLCRKLTAYREGIIHARALAAECERKSATDQASYHAAAAIREVLAMIEGKAK